MEDDQVMSSRLLASYHFPEAGDPGEPQSLKEQAGSHSKTGHWP
jgi:hypothetical protein